MVFMCGATSEKLQRMRKLRCCALACFLLVALQLAGAPRNAPRNSSPSPGKWIATWAASPQPAAPDPHEPLLNIEDQTVRERVRVSIGGTQIRIRLSNEYGSSPVLIGSASVGVPIDPASVRSSSIQTVTFGGRNSVTIPAGNLQPDDFESVDFITDTVLRVARPR